jgi:elongation factor Ts
MNITMDQIKEIRDKTSAGISDCKKALEACGGDIEKAVEELRKKGLATAQKKAGRATNQGVVEAYIHHDGKLGVLVELNCETDFVAKTPEFKDLAKQIAMQIAVDSPLYLDKDSIPCEIVESEKAIYRDQLKKENKPDHIVEKILEGKLEAFYKSVCLVDLPTIRDPKVTIHELIQQTIGTIQENISVRRFSRFRIGEEE